jgi:ABC-type multidrug transport system permease subunit
MWSSFLLDIIILNILFTIFSTKVIQLKEKFQQNTVVCFLLACVSSVTTPTSYSLSYLETDLGFKTGGVILSAIFTRYGFQLLSPLSAPKRPSTWMSLQIG